MKKYIDEQYEGGQSATEKHTKKNIATKLLLEHQIKQNNNNNKKITTNNNNLTTCGLNFYSYL